MEEQVSTTTMMTDPLEEIDIVLISRKTNLNVNPIRASKELHQE
jgi:hypothetical protein